MRTSTTLLTIALALGMLGTNALAAGEVRANQEKGSPTYPAKTYPGNYKPGPVTYPANKVAPMGPGPQVPSGKHFPRGRKAPSAGASE